MKTFVGAVLLPYQKSHNREQAEALVHLFTIISLSSISPSKLEWFYLLTLSCFLFFSVNRLYFTCLANKIYLTGFLKKLQCDHSSISSDHMVLKTQPLQNVPRRRAIKGHKPRWIKGCASKDQVQTQCRGLFCFVLSCLPPRFLITPRLHRVNLVKVKFWIISTESK